MLLGCAGTRRRGEGPGEGGTGITGRWHVMLHFNRSHQERTHPFGLGVTSCYSTPLLNPTQPLGTLLASLLSPAFLSSCVGCFSPPIYKPCGMCHFHFFFRSIPCQGHDVDSWSQFHSGVPAIPGLNVKWYVKVEDTKRKCAQNAKGSGWPGSF